VPAHHPSIAAALGSVRRALAAAGRRRLLVACSGGADSTALLGLLALIAPADGLDLAIGHVDHGLREASVAEATHVAALAARLGVPVQVTRLALTPGAGLAARAREARRAALREQADHCGAGAIALGHTQTDQAETVLMHITRGAGLAGVAAMAAWDSPWLRPLLDLPRSATRALCERLELSFVDDPTNLDPQHPRVRMREQILPALRRENPQVEAALGSLAAHAGEAEAALAEWAAREAAARRCGPAAWSTAGLAELPRAVRTRLLRRICGDGGVDLGALGHPAIAAIDRAIGERATNAPAAAAGPRAWDLRPGRRLHLDRRGLHIEAANDGGVPEDGGEAL
jgi:tRNA(Ile)-lysidine synthase